jgi:hypothetical protein
LQFIATDEATPYLQGLFSQQRDEPQAGVRPVDEVQTAHELQAPDVERFHGEVQLVDELQAVHAPLCSHSSEMPLPFSRLLCSHSSEWPMPASQSPYFRLNE